MCICVVCVYTCVILYMCIDACTYVNPTAMHLAAILDQEIDKITYYI